MRTNFLNEDYRPEDPLRKVVSARQQRRIARILNDFQGVNCRVEKPSDAEGRGWRIVVDGTTDIEDPRGGFFPIPDTSGYNTAINPDGRQTLEKNAETVGSDTASHLNEWQLRNVNFVKEGSSSIPFFVSVTPLQGSVPDKVSGELYWAQVDSKRYNNGNPIVYKSIDIANDYSDTTKGKWNLGLYDFISSASCSAPYSIHSGATKTLTWQVPVAIAGNPFASAPYGTVTYLSSATATWSGGSYASILVNTKTASVQAGTINFAASETPGTSIKAQVLLSSSDVNAAASHDSIQGTASSTLHDSRYLHRATGGGTDKWSSYNQCESIAYTNGGHGGINFATGVLYDTSVRSSINYDSRTLIDQSANATVDWQNRTLKDQSTYTTVDWQNRVLKGSWFIGTPLTPGYAQGATVLVSYDTNPFTVLGGSVYPQIRAYHDGSPDFLPRTEIRGLRLYARDSATVYFDLEITDGVLTFRDHTGANCGEIRRSL